MKISVLVPVYNVEPYIRKCLDSILAQTYGDLEIILVDDGSTDSSGAICDEYALLDRRIKVIHQANGGRSAARNAALAAATGDCIGWVDSDDWIEPNMYQHLMEVMLRTGSDIVQCGHFVHEDDGTATDVAPAADAATAAETYSSYTLHGLESFWEHRAREKISIALWPNLYKAELFEGLRFSLGHNSQDAIIFPEIAARCKAWTKTDLKLYHYRKHVGGVTREEKTMTHLLSHKKVFSTYFQVYSDAARPMREAVAFHICVITTRVKRNLALSASGKIDSHERKAHNKFMSKIFRACYKDARSFPGYKKTSAAWRLYWLAYYFSPALALCATKSKMLSKRYESHAKID